MRLAACLVVIACGRIDFGARDDASSDGLGLDATASSGVVTLAGNGSTGCVNGPGSQATFNNPVNVDFGPSGLLYVSDYYCQQIRAIAPDLTVSQVAGGLLEPFGIAGTATTLYVQTDFDSQGMQKSPISRIDVGTGSATELATNFGQARGLAVLPDGTIAFSDVSQAVIRRLDPSTGTVTPIAGQLGVAGYMDGSGAGALFDGPYDVVPMPDGSLAVSEINNNRIRRITLDGTVSTLAGDGTQGELDGPALQAQFNVPKGLGVDAVGNVYIGDDGAAVIRRLSPSGMVKTVAGIAGAPGFSDAQDPLQAQFYHLEGLTVRDRYIYVADGTSGTAVPANRIRRIDIASLPP